jgi:DNA-directed RNA polymerase sigma subunit (sigma70/sigma32)
MLSQRSRRKVADLRIAHPDWTLREIGRAVGITPERVRQLLVVQRLRTTSNPRRYRWGPVKPADA